MVGSREVSSPGPRSAGRRARGRYTRCCACWLAR